jgi:hypothetical protein
MAETIIALRRIRLKITMTRPAPKSQAHLAAMMPTGPAPKTTTVSPG